MSDRVHNYGFTWGPMDVTRTAEFPSKGRLIAVSTAYGVVEIWVSEKGRAIRVFRGGKELT